VIFGPNGAGKSTLLKIISTRMVPTSGRVWVLGMDPAREGAKVRSRVGVVFHDHFLRGELTLEENLRYFAELHGMTPDLFRARAPALAKRLGLAARWHDPVRTFSQGMVKRATLIRSLLHEPRVWILDEPFSGLDPEGLALLEEMVSERRSEGSAVILVTHDVEAGLRLADDCAAIVAGAVRARGRSEVEEYLSSPKEAAGKEL
jgi:heme exporter protein A